MKTIRWLMRLLILGGIIWLIFIVHQHPGYCLITYKNTRIEMTLWFGLLSILLSIILLYAAVRLLKSLFNIPNQLRKWRSNRKLAKSQAMLASGLLALMESSWTAAEKQLAEGGLNTAPRTPLALACLLLAAKSAYAQDKQSECNDYLLQADELASKLSSKALQCLVAITKWRCQIKPTTIDSLDKLSHLLINLPTSWLLEKTTIIKLYREVIVAKLDLAIKQSPTAVKSIWKALPQGSKRAYEITLRYAAFLADSQQVDKAVEIISKALKTSPHPLLIIAYGNYHSSTPEKQIKLLSRYLKTHPELTKELQLSLGRLYVYTGDLVSAERALKASLYEQPSQAAYLELSHLFEAQSQTTQALFYCRKANMLQQQV